MPELLEIELYRRSALGLVGHRIVDVEPADAHWCRGAEGVADRLVGCRVTDVWRVGKVLLIGTDGPSLGVRFGMTGRLVVEGRSAVPTLVYGAHGDDPRWVRFAMSTARGTSTWRCHVSDPRRLGGLHMDPDLSGLGPDAWCIDSATLSDRLVGRSTAVKSALLDQTVVAGLGNMLVDEVLLRAGISPLRPARSLGDAEVDALAAAIGEALPEMLAKGGSHTGWLAVERRRPDAPCPVDGAPLVRSRVGGRSAYWCPVHQM